MHQWRENVEQVLRCALISSTIIIIWKSLMVLTNTANPIVILLSSGIDSVVYARGNIFLLTNYCSESIRAGDIIVFRIQGRGLFIFHRVIRVHEKEDGYVKFLTKGDFEQVDERGLYAPGQLLLEKKDVVGKTFTTFELQWYQIGDKGVKHLANALQRNETLTTLNLYGNGIRDEGAKYLANALQRNKTLTTLYLGESLIGNEGAKQSANALQHNQTLTYLNLYGNNIGDEGGEYLANALQQNKTLTELDLISNQISDNILRRINKILQNRARLKR
ncbi:unnamed protein product [Adineta steineri]|uniref:Signal peptidase I n=1 Tax=Adineta steineri TaxID=433720 RepID=A0A818UGV1_9BILA|nr:unnamed protein product [Adineta steineri]